VKQHLLKYEEYKTKIDKKRFRLTFESITLDFFYSYVAFLKTLKNQKKEPLSQNTIAKDIRLIKVFMGEAVDLKLTKNLEYLNKKFSISEVETDAVYLSDTEINKLYNYDFSNKKKLEKVRDLFVFGCYVGLRFSDYSTIKKSNIISIDDDLFIKDITTKTKELVIIPCNLVVLEIFKKYESSPNSLPKSDSNQKFNDYIKMACKEAGLTETGRLSTSPELPLFECISSHTARRSFATNLYLDGYPVIEIMKITGHKTEKAFMKYIRVTKLDAAKRLSQHMKKRWEEKRFKATETLLKAV
jgi:integrase